MRILIGVLVGGLVSFASLVFCFEMVELAYAPEKLGIRSSVALAVTLGGAMLGMAGVFGGVLLGARIVFSKTTATSSDQQPSDQQSQAQEGI